MNISKNLAINIDMRLVSLHEILFSFLKCAQIRTENILSNANQQNYGTTFNKYYKSIYFSKPWGTQKSSFLSTSSAIIKNK